MKKGQSQLLAKADKRKYVKIRGKLSLGKNQRSYMTLQRLERLERASIKRAAPRSCATRTLPHFPPCKLQRKPEKLNAITRKALGKWDCGLKALIALLHEHPTSLGGTQLFISACRCALFETL